MIVFLQGHKVNLVVMNESLLTKKYLSWINSREVTEGLVVGSFPVTPGALSDFLRSNTDHNNAVFLGIVRRDNNEHIGNIKLSNFDWIARTTELGIMIGDSNSQGLGLARESCELVIEHAWQELNLEKVWLTVFATNKPAIALYEKLGFVLEGVQKRQVLVKGQMTDKLFYGKFKQ